MKPKSLILPAVALLALLGGAASASAEIVFLSSGRTLSVKAHRLDGDNIVLTLRSGGEVTCNKDLIENCRRAIQRDAADAGPGCTHT